MTGRGNEKDTITNKINGNEGTRKENISYQKKKKHEDVTEILIPQSYDR